MQKVLRQLGEDCATITTRITTVLHQDAAHRAANARGAAWGALLFTLALGAFLGVAALVVGRLAGLACPLVGGTALDVCGTQGVGLVAAWVERLGDGFGHVVAVVLAVALILAGAGQVTWRQKAVLGRGERRKLEGYASYVEVSGGRGGGSEG